MAQLLPIAPAKITWTMVWNSLRKTPWKLTFICTLFITNSVLALVTPWQIGRLIDAATTSNLHSFLWRTLTLILGSVILSAFIARLWVFHSEIVGTRVNQDLGIDLIKSSLNLDAQTIEDAGGGDLVSRITDDLDSVRRVITQGIPELMAITVSIIVIALSIYILSPMLGLMTAPCSSPKSSPSPTSSHALHTSSPSAQKKYPHSPPPSQKTSAAQEPQ